MENTNSLSTQSNRAQQAVANSSSTQNHSGAASASRNDSRESSTPAKNEIDAVQAEALADELNQALAQIDGSYSVSVDGDTGMMVVRITDVDTGEIVKQVPPQQVLDTSITVEKIIGLLVNDRA